MYLSRLTQWLAIAAISVISPTLVSAVPAQAGPTELALLSNYVGEWAGAGVLEGGDAPQPFRCRLTIDKGNQARINYAGRCTLVNMNLSVSGTIAFNDASRHYEAIMTSNAGFTGLAVGRVQGENIVFALTEKEADRAGNNVRLGAGITLSGASSIVIDYQVEFNDSGRVLTATVPFSR
jgi:hypothetical protein